MIKKIESKGAQPIQNGAGRIISLDEILPKDWQLYELADYYAACDEIERITESALRMPLNYPYKENNPNRKIANHISEMQKKKYKEALGRLGLDNKRINRYCDEIEENIGVGGERHEIQYYAPLLSFINSYLGFRERTIVEVGPGRDGTKVLKYMASKGTNAIGLDIDIPEESTEGIRFIQDRWENISQHLNGIDAIYAVYMHPRPYLGGAFNFEDALSLFPPVRADIIKERKCRRDFDEHIAIEMSKALKQGGLFMINYVPDDIQYTINNLDVFKANGFKECFFVPNHWTSHIVHVMQKRL